MNFTLPSVSGVNIEQKTGDLEISKQVIGEDDPDKNKEFTFDIKFTDANGSRIWDDYAYTRTKNDGSTETDLVLHNGSQFSLKAGETIRIKYLPIGLRYEITELDPDGYTVTNTVDGVLSGGRTAQGTIIKDVPGTVVFTNTMKKVGLTLQKLDQDGKPLKGAVFELKNAADNSGLCHEGHRQRERHRSSTPSRRAGRIRSSPGRCITSRWHRIRTSLSDKTHRLWARMTQQLQEKSRQPRLQKMSMSYRQTDGSYSFRCEAKPILVSGSGLAANLARRHIWCTSTSVENGNDPITPHTNAEMVSDRQRRRHVQNQTARPLF